MGRTSSTSSPFFQLTPTHLAIALNLVRNNKASESGIEKNEVFHCVKNEDSEGLRDWVDVK